LKDRQPNIVSYLHWAGRMSLAPGIYIHTVPDIYQGLHQGLMTAVCRACIWLGPQRCRTLYIYTTTGCHMGTLGGGSCDPWHGVHAYYRGLYITTEALICEYIIRQTDVRHCCFSEHRKNHWSNLLPNGCRYAECKTLAIHHTATNAFVQWYMMW
jgi:hypothetical protein